MGKNQQTKKKQDRRAGRHNPVRVPDSHLGAGAGAAKAHPAKEQALLPIIEKLSAPDAADRVWACAAVSNLIQNDPSTRRLLQGKNIVGALVQRLTDSTEDVVVEAAGALRNLCIDGGYDLCAEMYNKGVLSPLTSLVGQISGTLDRIFTSAPVDVKKDQAEISKRKLVFDLAENVITILWCLSETSDKALTAINALSLLPFLLSFLSSRSQLPLSLVTSAAHCLYVLTDDNPPAYTHLRSDSSWINAVVDVIRYGAKDEEDSSRKGKGKEVSNGMDGVEGAGAEEQNGMAKDMLLRVLACGTIRHISPLPPLLPVAALDLEKTLIIPLLNELLDLDLTQLSNEAARLASDLPDAATIAASLKDPKTDHKTPSERALEEIEKKLTTLQVGLEVLMGICSKVPEDKDEDEDVEETPATEEEADEMMDEDMEGEQGEVDEEALISLGRDQPTEPIPSADASLPLPSTLVALLSTLSLPTRLLNLSKPTQLSFLPINTAATPVTSSPSPHPPTTALLSTIHLRSLETLNNLLISTTFFIPSPASPEFSSPQWQSFFASAQTSLQPVWDGLFAIAGVLAPGADVLECKGQEVRKEILDVLVGGLMGVAGLTRGCVALGDGQVEGLIQVEKGSGSGTKESLRCRVLGTLSALAARDKDVGPKEVQTNKTIGTYLMTLLTSPSLTPEPMVVILNGVFDIYADETSPWDVEVFRKGNFLDGLKSVVGKVRSITRGVDKRKEAELRARADEAYENLVAFIKYRRSVA